MRFIVDECTGPEVARWLKVEGHEVYSVFDEARGMSDVEILDKACSENCILITLDGDFSALVFRLGFSHRGIVFLRIADQRSKIKIAVLKRLLEGYADRLADQFVVCTEASVRFARTNPA